MKSLLWCLIYFVSSPRFWKFLKSKVSATVGDSRRLSPTPWKQKFSSIVEIRLFSTTRDVRRLLYFERGQLRQFPTPCWNIRVGGHPGYTFFLFEVTPFCILHKTSSFIHRRMPNTTSLLQLVLLQPWDSPISKRWFYYLQTWNKNPPSKNEKVP